MTPVSAPRPLGRRIRLARVAALLVSSAAVVAAASGPAAAAGNSPTVEWSGRSDHLAGSVPVRAEVSAGGPVDGWVLRGFTPSGEPAFDPICDDTFRKPRRSFTVECRWNTTRYSDGRWSANQRYLLRVEVRRGDSVDTVGPERDTSVDNPAAAPTGVTVTYDPDGRRAVVAWAANPEPDVDHYDIEEQIDQRSWRPAGETTTTSFERALIEPGRYRFRVAADRRGSHGEAGRQSEWTTGPASPRKPAGRPPKRGQTASDEQASPDAAASENTPEQPMSNSSTGRSPQSTGAQPTTPADRADPIADTRSGAATRSPGPAPPAVAARGRDTPPATAAAPAFSASSGTAFQALALSRPPSPPPHPGPPTTPPPAYTAEPDDGFDQALPYPSADAGPEPDEEDASEGDVAEGTEPATGRPVVQRLGRLGGMALIGGGAAVLALAVRPNRRPHPETGPPPEPVDLPSLHDIHARLERLEAEILAEPNDDDSFTPSWQLPTG